MRRHPERAARLTATVGAVVVLTALSANHTAEPDPDETSEGALAAIALAVAPEPPSFKEIFGPPEPVQDISLLFTGDMLPSDALRNQAARNAGGVGFDFGPMLADVAPIIGAADWAVCHQETAVSVDNSALAGYPRFNAPFELAMQERAVGYDACSTASNHTVDLGMSGIESTLTSLDSVGIRHTGSARTPQEQATLTIYDVRGVDVGHLSYTYGLNGLPSPAPWAVNLIDPLTIRTDAQRLKQAGADVVVVSLHFGEELIQTPSSYQEQVVRDIMLSPDVDLIVGHHAHVVQPIERLPDGRWVIYGLGNFLAQMGTSGDPAPPHRDGVIVQVTFSLAADGTYDISQVGYVPVFVEAPADVVRMAPDFSRQRTESALNSRGAPLVDLTPR